MRTPTTVRFGPVERRLLDLAAEREGVPFGTLVRAVSVVFATESVREAVGGAEGVQSRGKNPQTATEGG